MVCFVSQLVWIIFSQFQLQFPIRVATLFPRRKKKKKKKKEEEEEEDGVATDRFT